MKVEVYGLNEKLGRFHEESKIERELNGIYL